MKKVSDQFQIGDSVIYTPEGVVTKVVGYLWGQKIGGFLYITYYQLECGINVPRHTLKKVIGEGRCDNV